MFISLIKMEKTHRTRIFHSLTVCSARADITCGPRIVPRKQYKKRIFPSPGDSIKVQSGKLHEHLAQTNKLGANRHRSKQEECIEKLERPGRKVPNLCYSFTPLQRPLKLSVHPFLDLNQTVRRHESKKHLSLSIFRPWSWQGAWSDRFRRLDDTARLQDLRHLLQVMVGWRTYLFRKINTQIGQVSF